MTEADIPWNGDDKLKRTAVTKTMYKTRDFKCPECLTEKKDEFVKDDEVITCACGTTMIKTICAPNVGGMDNLGRSGSTKLPD